MKGTATGRHAADPLPSYVRGSVALLGDAAHAMGAGLERYDRLRRPCTPAMARTAGWMARFGQQLRNPVAVAVRIGAMAVLPPRLAVRSLSRPVDWRPPQPARVSG